MHWSGVENGFSEPDRPTSISELVCRSGQLKSHHLFDGNYCNASSEIGLHVYVCGERYLWRLKALEIVSL